MTIISADGHCGAKLETYRQYLEKRFYDDLDELIVQDEVRNAQVGQFLTVPDETLEVIDRRHAIRTGGLKDPGTSSADWQNLKPRGWWRRFSSRANNAFLMPFFSVTNRIHIAPNSALQGFTPTTAGWQISRARQMVASLALPIPASVSIWTKRYGNSVGLPNTGLWR